ncbi:unnamed protein product [Fraxinus pennsylvanica]|uniref:Fringe-like glycosyltransferase domain-containing protein n=1 Tax=Fraxinus pennsylvanica TaxID=56036 RepID=A0AAD2E4J3_9LAMI|nr:unnamed protein product [Fraxinus pennsylvanica]
MVAAKGNEGLSISRQTSKRKAATLVEGVPPYHVSDNLTKFLQETQAQAPVMIRMVHGIMEVFREVKDDESIRWIVIGDDDSMFFVENMVDVLAKYEHTKYYYLGEKVNAIKC